MRELAGDISATTVVPRQEVHMVYVPQVQRIPAHILVTKTTRYQFFNGTDSSNFKKEIAINPLMHNISLVAQIQRRGKKVREYDAIKSSQSVLSSNKSSWVPGRTKLALVIPHIDVDEELVVTTKYSWMETRWHEPILLEASDPTLSSKVTVDVPFGITMRFKAANDGESFEFLPTTEAHDNAQWRGLDNRMGQGTRYIFEHEFATSNSPKNPGKRLQLFFAFDSLASNDTNLLFENWESVSRYLYNRIDRYDLPSNAIRDFVHKECADKDSDTSKINRIMSFLSHEIERRTVASSLQEQEIQPATRTFARRAGTPFDIVILAKAMLSSIGISADIVAVSDPEQNPKLDAFYSPALFDKAILAVFSNSQTFYFDPTQKFVRLDQVPTNLQGQNALLLRPSAGQHFALPFEPPHKNQATFLYDLSVNAHGMLEGSFSMDLTGIRADQAKAIATSPLATLSATTLQNKLLYENLALRWQKASLNQGQSADGSLNFTGVFSPRLLTRGPQQEFILPIKEIFEPALLPLVHAARQNFSSLTVLEASLLLPENFTVAQVPLNLSIDQDGITGRYLVTHEQGRLIFQAEAMVSLPLKADKRAPLSLPEQHIAILEMAEPEAAPHGESTSN